MSDFDFTNLEDGEDIEFGIATSSSSYSQRRIENGVVLQNDASTSERKIGVTNRRVIVETVGEPQSTLIVILNDQVSRVQLQRDEFMGRVRLNLASVETASGEKVEVGIGALEADDEPRLQAVFPNAEIVSVGDAAVLNEPKKKKGIFGFLGFGD